jgi:hypothetical protein
MGIDHSARAWRRVLRALTCSALVLGGLMTAGVAANVVWAEAPSGCCGVAESAEVCNFDSAYVDCSVGQAGDAFCANRNGNFPHCCEAGGFCS